MPYSAPPYTNITGLFIQSDKHVSDSLADYDGSAKPGQLVVDSSDYTLYVGNSDGRLNAISSGGGSGSNYSNANVAAYLPTYTGVIQASSLTTTGTSSNISGNLFLTSISEQTTGNTPLVMINLTESGNVGYDSTIYYNHTTESLQIGNLSLSDTPAATGISISTAEAGDNGTMFFTVAAGSVISFTGDRRVAWALLPYANIPNPSAGSIIYNNDSANAANGFYLCSDQGFNRVWEKVIAAKNTVVQLPGNTAAPTAVAGGVYYNSTNKAFYMCANVSLGWQVVNLT